MKGVGTRFSLRIKVAVVLFLTTALLLGVILFIARTLLLDSYLRIEHDDQVVNVHRVKDAISGRLSQLDLTVRDWARWDDTYAFMQDQNEAYKSANLGFESVVNLEINGMVFLDNEGTIIYKKQLDASRTIEIESTALDTYFVTHPGILRQNVDDSAMTGLIHLPEGVMMYAARPIIRSDGTGPVRGTLVFIKVVDDEAVKNWREQTHLYFELFHYGDADLPLDVQQISERILTNDQIEVIPLSSETSKAFALLPDSDGNPILILELESPRAVFLNGQKTIGAFTVIFVFFSVFFYLIVAALLEVVVLRFLIRLNNDLKRIRDTKDKVGRVDVLVADEIGDLALSINALLSELAVVQNGYKQKNTELVKQVRLVNEAKQAISHLAEDLEKQKNAVEQTVILRTKELSEERSRLLASIQSLQLGFGLFDAEGNLLLENLTLRKVLGLRKKKVTLSDIGKLFPESTVFQTHIDDCLRLGTSFQLKDVAFGDKYLQVFMNVVEDANLPGKNIGAVLLIEDVTAAKLVDKAKSEFVSVASHQLRTPLSIINWYLELLESGDSGVLDTEQRTFVEEIAKSSKRMVMLVNTLLDVSRLELGSLKLDEKLTDVSAVVAHAVNELHYKVEEQKLKVITEFAKIPKIFLDDRHFESVVQNIFANALKYTPEGGEVRLRVVESAAGETFGGKKLSQASIAVEISDTGYGIPKQQQDKIFDKFFRADNVLDKDEPGTGLGLYIAKSVIEAMGGNIWFVSREGKGSTFYITVPKRTENK